MHGLQWALQNAGEMLRKLHANPDAIPRVSPEEAQILSLFSSYARRAQSELAHYGLKTADG